MSNFNDTDRLNWVLSNQPTLGIDSNGENQTHWIGFTNDKNEQEKICASNHRECIDQMLLKNQNDLLKNELATTYVLTIGDWSCDGHSYYRKYAIKTNKQLLDIQTAYKQSCLDSGVRFNRPRSSDNEQLEICVEYDSVGVTEEAAEKLKAFGIDISDYAYEEEEDEYIHRFEDGEVFVELILDFIAKSFDDFKYEIIETNESNINRIKNVNGCINGFWNDVLNVQFGYGLYEAGLLDDSDYHGDRD